MARDLRSSNVADLEVRASANGSELIPCELNGRDVYLTAQQIANLMSGSGLPFPPWTKGTNGDVTATVDDPTKTALTVAAMAAQTADLWDVLDENGNKLLAMEPLGHVIHRVHAWPSFSNQPAYQLVTEELAADAIDVFQIFSVDANNPLFNLDSSGGIECRITDVDARFNIDDTFSPPRDGTLSQIGANFPPTQIQRALFISGQLAGTVPLLTIDNTAGVVLRVLPSGAIGTSAGLPADGDINTGECFFTFDPTPGAAKVRFKGKNSSGVVVNANVPMT